MPETYQNPLVERIKIAAEKAKEKRPFIKPQIFDEVVALYSDAQARLDGQAAYLLQKTPAGFSPEDSEVRRTAGHERAKEYAAIETTIISRYGKDGERAMRAIGNETTPPSIFAPIFEQFYDSDKEGLRFGGIIGALAGGAASYLLLGQKSASIKGGLVIAASAIAGSWIANQIVQSVKDYMEDYRIRSKVKEIEKTKGQEKSVAPQGAEVAPNASEKSAEKSAVPNAGAPEKPVPAAQQQPPAAPAKQTPPGDYKVKYPTRFPGDNPDEKGWQPKHPTHYYTPPPAPAAAPSAPAPATPETQPGVAAPAGPNSGEAAMNSAREAVKGMEGVKPSGAASDHWEEGRQLPNAPKNNSLPNAGTPQIP